MRDVQKEMPEGGIAIDKVGVKNVKYPIVVLDKNNNEQHTVADINMFVNLPHHFRGTHMSRFIEVLNEYRGMVTIMNMEEILHKIKEKLDADSAHLEVSFSYFVEKEAPVSKAKSLTEYPCKFIAGHNEELDFVLEINVPVTSLCPCSKEISDVGAHNQRSVVKVQTKLKDFLWIEDLIGVVESSASSEIFSLLKREDEKYVTEQAYDKPVFVEDMVRGVAEKLKSMSEILWFRVESESFESIHNHNAYAVIEWGNR